MIGASSRQKWFTALGEKHSSFSEGVFVPHEIHDWLSSHELSPTFDTFESQGVAVGQGLRTGANGFFYADGVPIASVPEATMRGTPSAACTLTAP